MFLSWVVEQLPNMHEALGSFASMIETFLDMADHACYLRTQKSEGWSRMVSRWGEAWATYGDPLSKTQYLLQPDVVRGLFFMPDRRWFKLINLLPHLLYRNEINAPSVTLFVFERGICENTLKLQTII